MWRVGDSLPDSQLIEVIQGSERRGGLMIRSRRLSCGNDESHFEKEAYCSRRRETLLLDNQDPEPKKTEGMLVKPITRTDS